MSCKVTRLFACAGATGYIGSIVTEHLSASGVKTAALVRDPQGLRGDNVRLKRLTKLKHAGVQLLEGSLQQDTAQLVQTLQGYDTVVSFLQGKQCKQDQGLGCKGEPVSLNIVMHLACLYMRIL